MTMPLLLLANNSSASPDEGPEDDSGGDQGGGLAAQLTTGLVVHTSPSGGATLLTAEGDPRVSTNPAGASRAFSSPASSNASGTAFGNEGPPARRGERSNSDPFAAAGFSAAAMDVIAPRQHGGFVKHVEEGCPYRADDVNSAEGAVSTGTTIMACQFPWGVVMAADTRTSTGDYVANRASRKISKVYDKIFVCRCGSAADTQALTGFVQHYLGQHAMELGKQPTVNTAANLFKTIAYQNKDNLSAGLIVAGYDDKLGGQVYSIPLGGARVRVPIACDGSGSGYISGLIDSLYRPDMTEAEALEFVRKAVAHAMSRDGSSGGMVRTLVITKDKIQEDVVLGNKLPVGP